MKKTLAILAILAMVSNLSAASEFKDDFSGYKDGDDASSAWDTSSISWEIQNGSLINTDSPKNFAYPIKVPSGRKVSVEASLTVESPLKADWKISGLVIEQSDSNYWHFAMVESPESAGKKHFMELSEMMNGNWNAQTSTDSKLTLSENTGGDFDWQYGKTYKMKLEMSSDGIKGELTEQDGTVKVRLAYKFDGRAVSSGRPGLDNGGLKTRFDNFSAKVDDAVSDVNKEEVYPPCNVAGSKSVKDKATGFFHTGQKDGKWWLFTPQGDGFYAVGVGHVNYFAHWCEKLGYAPMHKIVEKKYGNEETWDKEALKRLREWGFNTLVAGNSDSLRHKEFPHTEFLNMGTDFAFADTLVPKDNWTGFPNVFNPRFEKFCDKKARQVCAKMKDDPWLIGYYIDNELDWFGKAPKGDLRNWALARPADDPAHVAAEKCDADGFARLLAEKYFSITCAAIRKYDPNHLILGCRFAGHAPADIWDICGKYCDVVTVNVYPRVDFETGDISSTEKMLDKYFASSNKPMMVTEWSFPALDAVDSTGKLLPCMNGAGMRVDTQEQKTRCCELMQGLLFSRPYMVGSDYFMYADEPALGISSGFPEDSNYGLVNENDKPYELLTAMFAKLNPQVYQIHAGETNVKKPMPGRAVSIARSTRNIMVENDGRKITVDNGILKLIKDKDSGNAWDSIEMGGMVLGSFKPLIHQKLDSNDWLAPDRIELIKTSEESSKVVVDMVFVRDNVFRTAYRFTIYSMQPFFLSQFLWLENIDTKPWKFMNYYHYANSFIGGSADGDLVNGPKVPQYYLPVSAWKDDKAGKQYGTLCIRQQDFEIKYWLDEKGGQHPDSYRTVDMMLKPGAKFAEPQPAIIVFGAPADEPMSSIVKRIRSVLP